MQLFYTTEVLDQHLLLTEQESAHCTRVLRMKTGDKIQVTDGKGKIFRGHIELAHDKKTKVFIDETVEVAPLPCRLHLYVGITKNADRLEWMLEKCVEMGLTSFTPLLTQRVEKKNIRIDRLQNIVLSAMKQSLKAWLPVVHPATHFSSLIQADRSPMKLMAHCMEDPGKMLMTEVNNIPQELSVYIGPEGDFTYEEVQLGKENNVIPISMGEARLRTETAGLLACSWMYLKG